MYTRQLTCIINLIKDITVQSVDPFGSITNITTSMNNTFLALDSLNGGIRVENEFTIRIYEELDRIYSFEASVEIDKYSYFSFEIMKIVAPSNLEFCIYEDDSEIYSNSTLIEDELRCENVLSTENDVVTISLGKLFAYRKSEVKHFRISQNQDSIAGRVTSQKSEVILSNLKFFREDPDAFYNLNDMDCASYDSNSTLVPNESFKKCVCNDGYVSSNQGKIVGKYDTCVPNLPIGEDGLFDQSKCDHFRQCASGFCNGVCTEAGQLNVTYAVNSTVGVVEARTMSGKSGGNSGLVLGADNKLNLYGEVQSMHELSQAIRVNKFTELLLDIEQGTDVVSSKICLLPEQDLDIFGKCSVFCKTLEVTQGTSIATVNVAKLFTDHTVEVKYVAFLQRSRTSGGLLTRAKYTSTISRIELRDQETEQVLNNLNECKDPNARRARNIDRNKGDSDYCMCYDGFISSNEKMRGIYDTCTPCLNTGNDCYFREDGDKCARVRILSSTLCLVS